VVEGVIEPRPPLGVVTTEEAPPPQRARCPQRQLRLALRRRPGDRLAEVGRLGVDLVEPPRLVGQLELGSGDLRELAEVLGVPTVDLVLPVEASGLLDRVPTDRVEHRDPRGPGVVAPHHQRLRHQCLDQRSQVRPADRAAHAHRGRRVAGAAVGEDGESRQ